jgi:HEAT repeat protein
VLTRECRRARGIGLLIVLALGSGCGTAPKNFRSLVDPAPLARARAVGLGGRVPDQEVIPALIARLEDPDPVVRLSAHEGLRRRTGQDLGFVAWADPAERAASVARWRTWWASQQSEATPKPKAGLARSGRMP